MNVRAYYRMVSGIDGAIGRFMQSLEAAGLADNTIIVYSADNGYYMGNRGLAGKWSHFEESLRVPLIIYDPRVKPSQRGQVTKATALNLDLPATFLDWAGIEIPKRYQGHSLQPIVNGENHENWRKETFHEHFAVRNRIPAFEGLRNENYKYVRYFDHENHEFLHDLKNDPDELINLASDPDYKGVLVTMRQRTTDQVDEYGGPLEPITSLSRSTDPTPMASAINVGHVNDEGFMKVFDGKNLRQWSGDTNYWSVKDGAITGTTDGGLKMNRFLTWKGSTIRNFDLRVKVKVTDGGNSGIQYRGTSRPDLGLDVVTGYQCDVVANNPLYNGMLYEEKERRILARTGNQVIIDSKGQGWIIDTWQAPNVTPNEWHEYRVLVEGNHHRHWIDGAKTVDVIDLDEVGRKLEGVLAVQVHVGPAMTIQYKDFEIKHLPDELPLQVVADHPIPDNAIGVRPQGKLPKGWTPPIYGQEKK